jgi:hypothetical protein
MGWFGPKLEPGERVMLRHPARLKKSDWILGTIMAAVVGGLIFAFFVWLVPRWRPWLAISMGAICFAQIILVVLGKNMWWVLITDRRLLVQALAPWRPSQEMPLGSIDSVSLDTASHRISVRGGERTLWINANLVELPVLKQALARAVAKETT